MTLHSDIYSLGVVLFELLAGRAAFQADSTLAIMRQIVDSPFPDILEINDEVPPEVARIIAKMTPPTKVQHHTFLVIAREPKRPRQSTAVQDVKLGRLLRRSSSQ